MGFCMDSVVSGMKKAGIDPEKLLFSYLNVYNVMLKDKPKDLIAGIHLCRGNSKVSPHEMELKPSVDDLN